MQMEVRTTAEQVLGYYTCHAEQFTNRDGFSGVNSFHTTIEERCIATVPNEYIPAEFLGGLGSAKRQRRGSAVESVRESLRRMSLEEQEEESDVT